MFNEDGDWDDEHEGPIPSKPARMNTQKSNSSDVKSKVVGKKSLLRTLQTLGSVPTWQSDARQQQSDSETELAPSRSKKKKKRSKRRKHGETTGAQEQKEDLDQTALEEGPVPKKDENKAGALKVKTRRTMNRDITSAKVNANELENAERLSRQQWRNKMKSKRKCQNKFKQNNVETEGNELESSLKGKPVKTQIYSNKNSEKIKQAPEKTKEKELKAQKRKKTEEDSDKFYPAETLKGVKQIKKEKKTNGFNVGHGSDISKQKAKEHAVQHEIPMKKTKSELREQNLKREKLRKLLQRLEKNEEESPAEVKDEPAVPQEEVQQDRSASLRSRMEQRLQSARFRYINEVLYSTTSGEARRMFRQDPEAFWIYHRGYTAQVQRWPANPVDEIVSYIQQKPPSLVVADFGCGDCKIARSVKNKVHSFDLAAACDLVTVCDMANVPLPDASVDVAVFCLSLMGTNLADFLAEANRVLKMGGVLKIAEVASRFENVRSFATALAALGFKMVSKDTENTHFSSFELRKTGEAPGNIKKFGLQLRPCVYKKR
ncbi:ribosomal RNA-processing protein 8 [Brachionichthys hirsutus]|uniref:ribosomal RNA-processing protein 8 n=1 Tax=Brachionichthys hirsutus TaxID=412623 RepID=UPI00360525E9